MLHPRTLLPLAALPLLLAGCGEPVVMAEYFTVINVSPSHGAVNIGTDADLRVTFSHPIDASSVGDDAIVLTSVAGDVVTGSLEVLDDAYTLTFKPDAPLDDASRYVLTLASGLGGESVGVLPTDIVTEFTTVGLSAGGNAAPTAIIEPLGELCELGAPFGLDGSLSSDPEGAELSYSWRIAGAPAVGDDPILDGADGPLATLTALAGGTHIIGLVVNDGVNNSSEAFFEVECF
ncbi:MAG: Ig-like domain-containing protein [Alphaproteobacteria bacterium]|nr:Ig-like domain-containing protein [Alphaproteobacteria bacterium]MCB9793502.1 Ig-like domain-containing protein [Alphaproteobacteria bacterium]